MKEFRFFSPKELKIRILFLIMTYINIELQVRYHILV